ncbi:MAG: DnaA/Hda family protein [Alphaproteobacteria bacterium]
MNVKQIPLNFQCETSYLAEDFIVSKENQDAVFFLEEWPDWQSPVVIIYGASGCGKTHLLKRFASKNAEDVVFLNGEDLKQPDKIVSLKPCIVIDNAEKCHDENLFHLFNMIKEENKTMLLSSQNPPARWQTVLPDLKSRLSSVVNIDIKSPSDELMAMVIVKMFSDRQLEIGKEALGFLIKNIERSFLAIADTVEKADKLALASKRAITIPLLKEAIMAEQKNCIVP